MRLSRVRYVTICQQFLVTAAVVAVGLSAAGVMTLQIVAPEDRLPDASSMAPAVRESEAYVATKPVAPKVREVKVDSDAAASQKAAKQTTRKAPATQVALSKPTAVHGYATVGVTWAPGTRVAEDQIKIQVRTLKQGAWSGWQTAAYHDDHGPDAGEQGGRAERPGTDAVVIGDVDQVQMRVQTKGITAPADLELAVIDPGTTKVVEQPAAIDTSRLHEPASGSDLKLTAMQTSPKPFIFSRAQWGANESLRDKSSLRYGTIKTGFIHHTVNANSYTPEQVPALIRGIYAYHTQSRGWSDIGYNFLVDRFGRIWEGRYGGVDRPVVGAHTLGYNEYSFAMSAIGNYDITEPPTAVLNAYAKLFAWKLSLYDIKADATHLYVKDRYLNAINGHRDVGQTACPGKYLYAKIPAIRTMAASIQNDAQLSGDPVNWPILPTPAGSANPTQAPAPAVDQPAMSFPVRSSLAGERWPDLIVKSPTDMIRVIPTHGIRTYKSTVVSKSVWWSKDLIVAVGDLTGDGNSDVLARDAKTHETAVYRGDGKGHVSTTPIAKAMKFAGVSSLVAGRDYDRDGKLDVIGKSRATGALQLFRGLGGGKFSNPVVLRKDWPYSGTSVGDFNGDKIPDVMAISEGTVLYLFPRKPSGLSFGPAVKVQASATRLIGMLSWGDLTGDNHVDVMTRDAGTGLGSILAGGGTGRFGQIWSSFSGFSSLTKTSMAPMVGTSAADVVGRDRHGHLVVVANSGRQNITGSLKANLQLSSAVQVLNVGDWDRNGRGDVIVRRSSGDLLVWYPGHADGTFGRGHSLGHGWDTVRNLSAVGDVTGDGWPDLLGRIGTGPWEIFPGNGNKGFKAPRVAPAALRTFNQVGVGTWTPVGGAALRSANGSIVPMVGSRVGDALRAADGSVDTAYDSYVGLGDVDGDGIADVLAREKGTGKIWLLPGKTTGGFAPRLWVANGFAGFQLIG